LESTILLDGVTADRKQLSQTCYVRQVDVLVSSATVRESILTAAMLKLPRSMKKQDKLARVDAIIEELVTPPRLSFWYYRWFR
jgi:ABC-type multidrug transport system ATPase subunit